MVLSSQTQKLLEDRMQRGGYPSLDALLHAALVALDEIESEPLDEETLAVLEQREAEIERGEYRDWEEVKAELRAKYLGK
ncbi:MAG TPA: hypothetical protein VLJ39_08570 [Tepidisphaeraceae bacterium]|jgi:Arc/MetJ-type ribon-helix-helix transcriptional regulator|nr:hypothetical protein [Tepidisphaeraceae bacterium]